VSCRPCGADCNARHSPHNARAGHYRRRYEARNARLARERAEHEQAIAARKAEVHAGTRSAVLEAIARAKAKNRKFVAPAGNAGAQTSGTTQTESHSGHPCSLDSGNPCRNDEKKE